MVVTTLHLVPPTLHVEVRESGQIVSNIMYINDNGTIIVSTNPTINDSVSNIICVIISITHYISNTDVTSDTCY